METCLLNEQDDCFDYQQGTINLQTYEKNIETIRDTYGDGICDIIKEMTVFNEKQRCDFVQLEQKYNLNSKLDKPLQSSQFLQEYSSNRLPTSHSQMALNSVQNFNDQSMSQISHLDNKKKQTSSSHLKPLLRQYDLFYKDSPKGTANTDRSSRGRDSYFLRNNFSTNTLQKAGSLNADKDNKMLQTNNSFVSNAESMLPLMQNFQNYNSQAGGEKDKSSLMNKNNKLNQQISSNDKQNNNNFDMEVSTPRQSISFVQQENFENQNQNSLNTQQKQQSDKQIEEFKKNTKLKGQLQNFYSSMRNQNDVSFLNSSLKLNARNKSINSQNNFLQSMPIDQNEDDKENLNASNVEILRCLKEESLLDNSNHPNNINQDNNNQNLANSNKNAQNSNRNENNDESLLMSQRSLKNEEREEINKQQTKQDINNIRPKAKLGHTHNNKSYDQSYAFFSNNEENFKKQNQSFLNPIKEEQNEQHKTSPQINISLCNNSENNASNTNQQNRSNYLSRNQTDTQFKLLENPEFNSESKHNFNISEIKKQRNQGQNHNFSQSIPQRNNQQYSQGPNNAYQSFFNQSNYQTSFVEAQSFYIQQRSSSVLFEVIEETYEDGSVYNGEKLKGKRHGFGKFCYADGGYYEGSWHDGCIEGYGKLYYPSGKLAYEGEWKRDKFTGQGVVYNDTPDQLENDQEFDYKDFDKMGECWLKYEGGFLDDLKQGQGVLYLSNGNKFIGGFLNDMVEGKGVFINNEGKEFRAHFSQNKLLQLL